MVKFIGVIIVIAIIVFIGVSVSDIINAGMFPDILFSTLPMALFCFAIGLISRKRLSKIAAYWFIFGMILIQNIAAYMYWSNVELWGTGVWLQDIVVTYIVASFVLAIPGIFSTAKG